MIASNDSRVDHMKNNCTLKLENCSSSNVTDYIQNTKMEESAIWATDAEILAAASLLPSISWSFFRSDRRRNVRETEFGSDLC